MVRLLHNPAVRERLRQMRPLYNAVFRRKRNYDHLPTPVDWLSSMQGRGVFLLCYGRSGSTVFADFLAAHPGIVTFGEVLGEESYYSYFQWLSRGPLWLWPLRPTLMEREFYRFCARLIQRQGGLRGLFDIKIESLHLIEGNWRMPGPDFRLFHHLRDAGVPVILLTRRDLVARYVSGQVAERRGAYHSYHGASGDSVAPFEIDINAIRAQVAQIDATYDTIRRIFASRENFVELAYEDLFVAEGDCTRFAPDLPARMAALFGVENSFCTTPRLQKVSGEGYGRVITNREAVEAYRAEVLSR
ncbi:hypothetical protein LAZ40_06455 [Cereibacter sphaeroides]|uniref:hypothetical protein n=1 Tax=Cereibacter sphaeroides TaxID=1063 RepID=UPI001F329A4D|nr:hypothetical protein [Cereibacter sphaeroides]MCE6958688.1 hypothetical protein [Cereibacter sphaeroides]MCE6973429.1 hypothetical protein [Cereibacter sphaeroides]